MNMRKILALLLALMLTLCSAAFAEDASEATEAPTEAAAEAEDAGDASSDEAVDEDPVIAEIGDVQIRVSDAFPQVSAYYQMLASYGLSSSSYLDYIKQSVLVDLVQQNIEKMKTEELGFNELTDEELAQVTEDAASTYQEMYNYYLQLFTYNAVEDPDGQTTSYLEESGYTPESTLEKAKQNLATNKLVDYVTADLVVTDEDLLAYYETAVTEDQEAYDGNYSSYEEARATSSDDAITWNPEGYRRVRQVLITFEDVGSATYASLLDERTKAENGEEGARSVEAVQADIDVLLSPLYQKAEEVRTKFDEGADINDLITEYGSDPGMLSEPGLTEGYYVCADSEYWDSSFVEAAMSVDTIGQLSEPFAGSYGLYMVYYLDDVTPGAVPYEDVRDVLDPECQAAAKREAYYDQLDVWSKELNVQFYFDNFVTPLDE